MKWIVVAERGYLIGLLFQFAIDHFKLFILAKMRIIVRYCLPWGNFSTQAIDIDPDAPVETLQGKIFEKFNIPIKKQLIKFKRDGFTVTTLLHAASFN